MRKILKEEDGLITLSLWICSLLSIVILFLSTKSIVSDFYFYKNIEIYPIGDFLVGVGIFDDFYNSIGLAHEMPNPKSSYMLSPFMIFLSRIMRDSPLISHISFLGFGVLIWVISIRGLNLKWLTLIPLLISYPIILGVFRSNPIFIAAGLVLMSLAFAFGKKENHRIGIILMCVATTIHPSCLIFLLAFPLNKIRENYLVYIIFFVFNVLIIFVTQKSGFINYLYDYQSSLIKYKYDYVIGGGGTLFNNSLYGLIKALTVNFSNDRDVYVDKLNYVESIYNYFSLLIFVLMSATLVMSSSWLKKIGSIALLSVLVPQISADYKLEFVLIFLIFLIYSIANGLIEFNKNNKILFFTLLLLIIPKHIVFFRNYFDSHQEYFTSQSYLNPIIIAICLLLLYRMKVPKMKN